MPSASELKPVFAGDWKDFIQNLYDGGKPSIAGLLDINAVGYQIGRVLYVPCKNEKLISKTNTTELQMLLDESASRAFGKKLKVLIESEENFAGRIKGLSESLKNGTETEEDRKIREAEEKLQAMVENQQDVFEEKSEESMPQKQEANEEDVPENDETENEEFIDDFDFPDEEN